MKKLILLLVLGLAGVAAWYFLVTKPKPDVETPRQQAAATSKHSAAFNQSVSDALNMYYDLSEALVNWDTAAVSIRANALKTNLEAIRLDELRGDTAIYQTAASYHQQFKKDLDSLTGPYDLTTKRLAYNTFSQNFYNLLRTIQYNDHKVYVQQCPMAFNDTEIGVWLSKTEGIRNPYLGLHHPKYKGGMLECGEVRETLDFAGGKK
jgi:hypothetical protein